MGRVQVLDQHERHARRRVEVLEKGRERLEPTGRSTHAHDRERSVAGAPRFALSIDHGATLRVDDGATLRVDDGSLPSLNP